MFVLPNDGEHEPAAIYKRLIETVAQFDQLREWTPDVAFLMRTAPEKVHQRNIIGSCSMPQVQGRHGKLFTWLLEKQIGYVPVFLFTLDAEWWSNASERQREILMFHEMLHAGIALDPFGEPRFKRETGEPVWALVGHDVEEFTEVVARYGAWDDDLKNFRDALNHGGVL